MARCCQATPSSQPVGRLRSRLPPAQSSCMHLRDKRGCRASTAAGRPNVPISITTGGGRENGNRSAQHKDHKEPSEARGCGVLPSVRIPTAVSCSQAPPRERGAYRKRPCSSARSPASDPGRASSSARMWARDSTLCEARMAGRNARDRAGLGTRASVQRASSAPAAGGVPTRRGTIHGTQAMRTSRQSVHIQLSVSSCVVRERGSDGGREGGMGGRTRDHGRLCGSACSGSGRVRRERGRGACVCCKRKAHNIDRQACTSS